MVENYPTIKSTGAFLEKLSLVSQDHVMDWLEKFITTMTYSASLYNEYFEVDKLYNMQDVNLKLTEIIDDLAEGNEKIKKYL